jgi:hypothetical protein
MLFVLPKSAWKTLSFCVCETAESQDELGTPDVDPSPLRVLSLDEGHGALAGCAPFRTLHSDPAPCPADGQVILYPLSHVRPRPCREHPARAPLRVCLLAQAAASLSALQAPQTGTVGSELGQGASFEHLDGRRRPRRRGYPPLA